MKLMKRGEEQELSTILRRESAVTLLVLYICQSYVQKDDRPNAGDLNQGWPIRMSLMRPESSFFSFWAMNYGSRAQFASGKVGLRL